MILKNKIVNFLGDSITIGHGTSAPEYCFASLIEKRAGLKRANNYGIGGTRIARQFKPSDNPDFDLDFCRRANEMDPDADIIVVLGGTNDFGHGDAPLGTPTDRTDGTYTGACHVMMQRLITRYPGKPIVICTPLHRCNEDNPRGDGNKPFPVAPLISYVTILREVAQYYSLPVLDLFAISGLQPQVDVIRETYVPDGLHPNDAGHSIIADRMIAFLESL